ncbi:hypothetical protein ACS126_09970 [Sphingobacterium lactis]|uniref:hypothetical protein n=1 Tax=Sphingobacterium lactis TaxID=797291 RepID=UPI003EC616DB
MAKVDLQIDLDDSALDRKIDELGKKMSEGMSDAFSKIKPPNIPTSKPPLDNNAVKTIQESISALGKLEDRAQASALRLAELKTSSSELASAKALLNFQLHSGEITASQYNIAMGAVEMQQRQVSLSLQELNREVKQNINLETAAAGSLQEARIKLAQMNAEIVKAGGAMDGSNKELDEMIAKQKELYAAVTAMENKMGNYTRNVGNYASGWNGMSNAINQITREMPAFTVSVQTGLLGISNNLPILFDEISKATAANRALTAEGKKGVPVWNQLAGSIFSFQTLLSVGVTLLTIYGDKMWEWIKAATKGTNALEELKKATKEINDARLDGAKSAQGEITSLNSLHRAATNQSLGYNERLKAVKKLQDQYPDYFKNIDAETIMAGKASKAYDKLSKSILATAQARAYQNKITEISSKMLENNDAILEKRNSVTEKDRAKMKFEDDLIKSGGMVTTASTWGSGTNAPRQALADADEMEKANAKLGKQIERYQTEIDKLALTNGVGVLNGEYGKKGKAAKTSNKEINEYKNLIQKIADIDRDYSRQFMSSNAAEIQAVRDKFAEIRKEVNDYNSKNPKTIIDVTKIDTLEQRAVKSVEYKQETSSIIESLEEQKKIYDDYNAYVKEVGIKSATSQYKAEMEIVNNFKASLNSKISAIESFGEKSNDLEKERLSALIKLKDGVDKEENEKARDNYAEAFKLAMTFNDKRLEIEKKYAEARKSLGKDITPEQEKELRRKESREISDSAKDDLMGTDAWTNLFDNLDELTANQLNKLIAEIEEKFDTLKLSFNPIDIQAVRKKLNEARDLVIQDNPFKQVGAALKEIFNEASDESKEGANDIKRNWTNLAKSTKASFDFVSDAINSADFLKEAIGEVGQTALMSMMAVATTAIAVSTAIKTAEKASVVLAVVQAALVVVNAIAGLFKSIFAAGDKRLEKSIQSKKVSVEELDRAFQNLQRSMERVAGEDYYKLGEAQIKNLQRQREIVSQMMADEEKKKKADKSKIQDYKNELNDIDNKIEDVIQSINDTLSQTTFKDFANEIIDALSSIYEEGGSSLDKFEKVYDDFIKNVLNNSLKMKYIEPIVKDMIESLTAYMKTNDNSLMGFDFELWKNKIGDAGEKVFEVLDSAYEGLGIQKAGNSDSSSIKAEGGIQRMTEETGTEIVGMFRSGYDIWKQQLTQLQLVGKSQVDYVGISNAQLAQLNSININTAATVARLDTAVGHLQNIDKNLGRKYVG